MIKKISKASLILKSLYINEKCRVLASSVSTSAVFRAERKNADFSVNKFSNKKYEDTFGNIESFERDFQKIKDDPEDVLEYKVQKAAPMKTINQYITEVKSLLAANDYKGALKLLEVDIRNDRKPRTQFIYRTLISYNAKVGNVEEAYRLFVDFKRRGGTPTPQMYTSVLNACANCKNSHLALEKAEAVRDSLSRDKRLVTNITHYNVMLKAYGRHCDLPSCFKIMDEVLAKRDYVKDDTFCFLLQACISDRNSGLRHAFLVWREMLKNGTKPSVLIFNLMLRCIRDCSMGEVSLIPDAIKEIFERSKVFYKRKMKISKTDSDKEKKTVVKIPSDGSHLIAPVEVESKLEAQDFIDLGQIEVKELESEQQTTEIPESLTIENQAENSLTNISDSGESCLNVKINEKLLMQRDFKLPNLLALKPTTGSVVEFNGMTTPEQRFLLVGGVDGFLKTMAEFGVKPNLKTFTQMFILIPENTEMEEKFIALMDSYKIEMDTAFFNVLLSKRIFRDHELIKNCLEKMHYRNIKPDIITFETLAKTCSTVELCLQLLDNIRQHGFRLNPEIIESLLRNANKSRDMNYVLTILRAIKEDGVKMSARNLALVSNIVEREKRRKKLERETSINKVLDEINNAQSSSSQVV